MYAAKGQERNRCARAWQAAPGVAARLRKKYRLGGVVRATSRRTTRGPIVPGMPDFLDDNASDSEASLGSASSK